MKLEIIFGLSPSLERFLKETKMTALQDAATAFATALAAALKAAGGDPTIAPHLATLDTEVAALQANDASDEVNIADLTAAVTTITSALNPPAPAPAPSPAPAPAPDSPAS